MSGKGCYGLTSASAFRSCVRRLPNSLTTFLAPWATAASTCLRCRSSSTRSSRPRRRERARGESSDPHPALPRPAWAPTLTWLWGPRGLQVADLHPKQSHLELAVPDHLLHSSQELPLLRRDDSGPTGRKGHRSLPCQTRTWSRVSSIRLVWGPSETVASLVRLNRRQRLPFQMSQGRRPSLPFLPGLSSPRDAGVPSVGMFGAFSVGPGQLPI